MPYSMIYRVASAISEALGAGSAQNMVSAARAAIEAMREPPEALRDPYWVLKVPGASYENGASADEIWRKAIDEALK